MSQMRVQTFFYGSYMNREVLAGVDVFPEQIEVARLPGYDLRIQPLANVVQSEPDEVYGIVADASHAELERLYAHAREVLGGVYLPCPVLVTTIRNVRVPALCYIAPSLDEGPAKREYVDRLLAPAREHAFPEWYLERIASFYP